MKIIIVTLTVLIIFIQTVFPLSLARQKTLLPKLTREQFLVPTVDAPPVQVDLFVMSKCPDASFCENVFSTVVKQVGSIMDLKVNYIAKGSPLQCMHGNSECIGNTQQLCVADLYPKNSTFGYTWFNFMLCQDETLSNIPNNGQTCASRLNLNWSSINQCTTGDRGQKLFQASVAYTQSFNVGTSCTIYLQKQPRCVHDGVWKNCPGGYEIADFVRDICHDYTGTSKPSACLI